MSLPRFALPEISSQWGPPEDTNSQFAGIPFAPFVKSDRLGRVSDWNQASNHRDRRYNNNFGGGAGVFDHKDEDESSFSLVDSKPKLKPKYGQRVYKKFPQNRRNPRRGRGGFRGRGGRGGRGGFGGARGGKGKRWGFNNWHDRNDTVKESSVQIAEGWEVVGPEILFDTLSTLKFTPPAAETLVECGTLDKFNPMFERTTVAQPTSLHRFESRQHFTATTSDDPVLEELANDGAGTVYATDTILSVIMAAARSIAPWDIMVTKKKGIVFLDKRPLSRIDFLGVNENWNEIQEEDKESVNHTDNLSTEATLINHNFSQQVVDSKLGSTPLARPNPFLSGVEEGSTAATVAYRYRKWDLGKVKLVSRTTVNGYTERKGEHFLTKIQALNEFDPKLSGSVDWRQKLTAQPGAVLAAEMKNNANKLTRWTAETHLSGAEEFRLGFVTRTHVKDNYRHVILAARRYEPAVFAQSINVNVKQLWGVLKLVLDRTQELDDGCYLLFKDPNKASMRFYSVPQGAFDNELDAEEDEEENE